MYQRNTKRDSIDAIYYNSLDRKKRGRTEPQTLTQDATSGISTWKRRNKNLIKCISIVLSFLFLHQQIGYTQDGKPVWTGATKVLDTYNQDFSSQPIEVPYDLAKTQEASINGSDEVIINIQDAHASLSAQYSVVELLNTLVTNYDLRIIALEGASGYKPFQTKI